MTHTITFNTGRTYTDEGQRIAAKRLECGAIAMIDIDRGIDYLFPAATKLTQNDVMRAYDYNENISPSHVGLSYEDYYAVLKELRAAAGEVACLTFTRV
jgi:hypothetical protein